MTDLDVTRIAPEQARQKVVSGEAVLVCAYESDDLCRRNRLEGSLSLKEFITHAELKDKNREIIFYCA